MSIYQKSRPQSKTYRKIYEDHFGPIPIEPNGRSYEIHHRDGNSNNNDPMNLVALSLQEHYDIHYQQEDYLACRFIAGKLGKSPDEMFSLRSRAERKKVADKSHNLLKRSDGSSVTGDRVKIGNHPFLTRPDGTSLSKDRVTAGTNPFAFKGKAHPKYLPTIYRFKNKLTGEIIDATYYDFRSRFNLDPSNLRRILSDPSKSTLGWQVINRE